MRKLAWLLVLPYVVAYSTQAPFFDGTYKIYRNAEFIGFSIQDKEFAFDFVAALNEAHEKRNRITLKVPGQKPVVIHADSEKFDYKSACGGDDCGAEPK